MLFKFKMADLRKRHITEDEATEITKYPHKHERQACMALIKAGLYTPVLTITHGDKAWPRAYHTYPVVYHDPGGVMIAKADLLIHIPDGYRHKGRAIKPDIPYEEIKQAEADTLLNQIGGNGWGPFCSLYILHPTGVALPEDYTKDETVISPPDYAPSHAFIIPKKDPQFAINKVFETVANDIILEEYGDFNIVTVRPCAQKVPSFLEKAEPLSLETYHWIAADAHDLCLGITPPPMPKPVIAELSKHALMIPNISPRLQRLHIV